MEIEMIPIGFGNLLNAERIVTIVAPDSAPVRRVMKAAKEMGLLVDATHGRKIRSVIILDSGHVALSSELVETISGHSTDEKATSETANRLFKS